MDFYRNYNLRAKLIKINKDLLLMCIEYKLALGSLLISHSKDTQMKIKIIHMAV